MSKAMVLSIRAFLLFFILCLPTGIFAQESEIDTSGYLPYFYTGSLNYNLMVASAFGMATEIDRLISNGADIDIETSEGATPLILAVSNNRIEAVKVLLNYNPDVNKITSNLETPLLIAAKNQNVEIIEALIRAGADVDLADHFGATALHYASIYGYFYIADLLVYYEASIDKKSLDGTTPLMAAIWAGFADIADMLIQNGANMEARDNDGFTPFLIAAQNADTMIMNMLIKKGIDLYESNKYNYDALAISIKTNQNNATQFLLSKDLKWASREEYAVNPYYVAAKYRRKEIIDLLKNNNVPGKFRPQIDQMDISVSSKFNTNDYFTGVSLSFREPLINGGIIAGCDIKLWYSRIMIKESESLIYQYMDKRSIAYAGLFKDFAITDNQFRGNYSFSASLSAACTFGNKLKGTDLDLERKIMIIPAIGFKWTKKKFALAAEADYMRTEYYKNGPVWMRIGCSYSFFFDEVRAPAKEIKWY